MELPDGSIHPNNGFCVQHKVARGKSKDGQWEPMTTPARGYNRSRCEGLIEGLQHAGYDKELRLLDKEGNVLKEWLHRKESDDEGPKD